MKPTKDIDYRLLAVLKLEDTCKTLTDYSLAEILFTAFQRFAVKNGTSLAFLMDVDDKTLYYALAEALERELDDDGRPFTQEDIDAIKDYKQKQDEYYNDDEEY